MKKSKLLIEKKKSRKRSVRALVLFSGGLDSILAVKILAGLEIEVTALTFVSYFFDAEQAKKSARENNIKLEVVDFSDEHLKIIKNPRYGRGAGMNPCIDCHLLMLKLAKIIAKKEGLDIIATGEVLGQRPMSQNFRALELIEKKAGLQGKILRPLSAKVLPETEAEKSGSIDRQKFYGISGRSRKGQMEMAKRYKIKYFPSPGGGCVLTEKEYSKKLVDLLENLEKPKSNDIKLLKLGRHFWSGRTKIIIGRNHEENLRIGKIGEEGDTLVELENIPGPVALVRGPADLNAIEMVKEKICAYTKNLKAKPVFKIEIIS
jgi:tRNA-uridine 2-sulfurtransferase